jgi:phosphopantetheinyl transferase (holo-ACP synthase)
VSIGNDIVDLADPETRHQGLHPRFDERVFRPQERALLGTSDSGHVMRWALWAAKESAYKALKRVDPEVVFSPKRFAVELSALPTAGGQGAAVGQVVHRGHVLDLQVHVDGSSLHAVATSTRAVGARLLSSVDRAASDPGATVRRLAAAAIASALALDPGDIRIDRRPPVALHQGRSLVTDLSLSHHGRFAAFACALTH